MTTEPWVIRLVPVDQLLALVGLEEAVIEEIARREGLPWAKR